MNDNRNYPARFSFLCWYVAITFLWSWGWWALVIFLHLKPFSHAWGTAYAAGLSGPLVAAFCLKWKELGSAVVPSLCLSWLQWRTNPRVYLLAFLVPPAVTLLAAIGFSPFLAENSTATVWSAVPLLVVRMILRGGPLNEEPGWRGYFLPALLT